MALTSTLACVSHVCGVTRGGAPQPYVVGTERRTEVRLGAPGCSDGRWQEAARPPAADVLPAGLWARPGAPAHLPELSRKPLPADWKNRHGSADSIAGSREGGAGQCLSGSHPRGSGTTLCLFGTSCDLDRAWGGPPPRRSTSWRLTRDDSGRCRGRRRAQQTRLGGPGVPHTLPSEDARGPQTPWGVACGQQAWGLRGPPEPRGKAQIGRAHV